MLAGNEHFLNYEFKVFFLILNGNLAKKKNTFVLYSKRFEPVFFAITQVFTAESV